MKICVQKQSAVVALMVASTACVEQRTSPPVPVVALGPALGAIPVGNEPHVLELNDGRVAITMMGLGALVVHDFASGRSDTIGRRGAGPGEFGRAGRVVPWGRDRFAVLDPVLRRVTVFHNAGGVDTMIRFPVATTTEAAIPHVSGVWLTPGGDLVRDSVPLLRVAAAAGGPDTLALIGEPPRHFLRLGSVGLNLAAEYAPRDRFGLLPDGRVWIARGHDNRIDWVAPNGDLTRGRPRAFPVIGTVSGDRHRLEGLPAPPILDTVDRELAPTKAPFQDVLAGPAGELWFWLNQPHGYSAELYEVRAPNGLERVRVSLPGAHKLVAIGNVHVYMLGEDATGDWVLTRRMKPAAAR